MKQGDYIVSSLSNVTLKSEETLVEVIIIIKGMIIMKIFMKIMKKKKMMMKMTMQAGDMLEGLCGEASLEAWLWRPPPGVKSDISHII